MAEIQTRFISINEPQAIQIAFQTLKAGGLVAFPTDTVYGLGALVHDRTGIERLFKAKIRDANKAIAVLIGDLDQLEIVAEILSSSARQLAAQFWPGALTLVVPRHPELPENISPIPTVGVRMPDHAFVREMLRITGPLATTSANLSGGANPRNARDVMEQLNRRVELVLDGGDARVGVPSTVVDCTQEPVKILRHGAILEEDIFSALE